MAKRRKVRRTTRVSRDLFKARAERRLDRVYFVAMRAKRLDVALESVKALARLYNLSIDSPCEPGTAPTISPEGWQQLLTEAEERLSRQLSKGGTA